MGNTKRFVWTCLVLALSGIGAAALAQTAFPLLPSMSVDPDGTLHWSERSIPLPALASAEARKRYVEILDRSLAVRFDAAGKPIMRRGSEGANARSPNDAALQTFPVDVEETEIGGVKVAIYTARDVTPRNRNRVVMNFNSDPVGIILAAIGKMKVVAVHYTPTTPKGNADIVAVYRALLESHEPSQIAWVGLSGGCQFGGNTAMWLPEQQLPFPAAIALMTCAGGSMPGGYTQYVERPGRAALRLHSVPGAPPPTAPTAPGRTGRAAERNPQRSGHSRGVPTVLLAGRNARHVLEPHGGSPPQTAPCGCGGRSQHL